MKTIRVSALRLLLLVPCLSFSDTLNINSDSVYASGVITIIPDPNNTYTIAFSNGICLSEFDQHTFIPEPVPLFQGIVVDSNSAIVSAGFKKSTTGSWQVDSFDYISEKYYAANDTVWNASLAFPDSLMHLDSLIDNPYGHPDSAVEGNGKWLYCSYPVPRYSYPYGVYLHIMKGYNNIMYVSSMANKMKLQVSHIFWNRTIPSPYPIMWVDSLRLLWAVDSLGNGIFKPTTSIKDDFSPPPGSGKRNLSNFKSLRELINSGLGVELYTPSGKLVGRIGDASRPMGVNAFPAGIILYKIKQYNQSPVWGKVMAR